MYPMDSRTTVLVIGDVHIKLDNLLEIQTLEEKLLHTITVHQPDIIIFLGDVLHTHERVHTNCLNQAAQLFRMASSLRPTFVLVGNHDFISNSQFLTTHHWMNPFKQWPNLSIIDQPYEIHHHTNRMICCPYVPDGRFVEALHTLPSDFNNTHMIFAHQTLDGVKLGMTVAAGIEEWKAEYPFVCSGHIHDRQRVQPNLYYTGTPMPHAFGERNDKSVSLFTLDSGVITNHTELRLEVCTKRIEYLSLAEAKRFTVEVKPHQLIRLTIKATQEEARAFKRTDKYKELVAAGVKIVLDETVRIESAPPVRNSFEGWLLDSIRADPSTAHWYRKFVGRTPNDPELFLLDIEEVE